MESLKIILEPWRELRARELEKRRRRRSFELGEILLFGKLLF